MEHALVNRRYFLGQSLGVSISAASWQNTRGANDRIRVANIGCGRRGLLRELIQVKDATNIEIAAVCDTWRQKREKAAADVKEHTGRQPDEVVDYRDVLSRKDIDAVIIGTPDHQHCTQLIAAVEAGKDVYVEKPLAMNMKELVRAFDAVKRSGRVVQMGTQMRSYRTSTGARQFVTGGGLGKILKVEQVRNSYMPYWMSYGGPDYHNNKPAEADVDWKLFLMNRPNRPFDSSQYQNWYGYREYSLGPQTNLMVHFIDVMHYITGAGIPQKAVALGGTYRWKNEYTVPDSIEVALEYPEGFLVRYCTMMGNGANNYAKFFGTRGTLDAKSLSPRTPWTVSGEGVGDADRIQQESAVPEAETVHHMQNFLECVRTRNQPIAPIEAGYAHSVAVIMADEALMTGRRMVYDSAKRDVKAG